jgi:hypothetical protein
MRNKYKGDAPMKTVTMTHAELQSISGKQLEQFAVASKIEGDKITALSGDIITQLFNQKNGHHDDVTFDEILNWYLVEYGGNSYVILRVLEGSICQVEIEEIVVRSIVLDEGLTTEYFKEEWETLGDNSKKEELIAFLESDYIKTRGKEDQRQKALELLRKQDEFIPKVLIQLIRNNFGDRWLKA